MNVRNIGIVGYAFVLPVVMLLMGKLFAATPAASTDLDQLASYPPADEPRGIG
jgi:hypothetical protein